MYPGYGTKGIELDVFMYIAYLMIIILIILIVLNKVNNKGDFDSQDFKNPIALGICFLEDNGYNIFLFGNIFMFMYISRFVIKGLNLLGSKEVSCPSGNKKTCLSEEEVDKYSNIIECNNKMEPVVCQDDHRKPITLPGCPTVDDEYLKSVFDYKTPLNIVKEGDVFKLKDDDENNPSYSELSTDCRKSLNDFLGKFKSDNFPPDKCGSPETTFPKAGADQCEVHPDQPPGEHGHSLDYRFHDGAQCNTQGCAFKDCCTSPLGLTCQESIYNTEGPCDEDTPGTALKSQPLPQCVGHACTAAECCAPRQNCTAYAGGCPDGAQKNQGHLCSNDECKQQECCIPAGDCSPTPVCSVNSDWAVDAPNPGEGDEVVEVLIGHAETMCKKQKIPSKCEAYGGEHKRMGNTNMCKWGPAREDSSPSDCIYWESKEQCVGVEGCKWTEPSPSPPPQPTRPPDPVQNPMEARH